MLTHARPRRNYMRNSLLATSVGLTMIHFDEKSRSARLLSALMDCARARVRVRGRCLPPLRRRTIALRRFSRHSGRSRPARTPSRRRSCFPRPRCASTPGRQLGWPGSRCPRRALATPRGGRGLAASVGIRIFQSEKHADRPSSLRIDRSTRAFAACTPTFLGEYDPLVPISVPVGANAPLHHDHRRGRLRGRLGSSNLARSGAPSQPA